MKIVIATDKFKGSLTAEEACDAVRSGLLEALPQASIKLLPMADGGEGSLEVIENALGLQRVYKTVLNPLFDPVKAFYGIKDEVAYIEMAKASGLQLLPKADQNPELTTTLGTGELIRDAIENGAKSIYLFVGGSATNDAGIGMASALGYTFLDKNNQLLAPIGASLQKIKSIVKPKINDLATVRFFVVTDVQNKLYGKDGAAYVFAGQKGATTDAIKVLDDGLKHIAKLTSTITQAKDYSMVAGSGAAGGLGWGAMQFLGANLLPGITTIIDVVDFKSQIAGAGLVVTGEGKLDTQTLEGKVVKGVLDTCIPLNIPVGILCGINDLSVPQVEKLRTAFCLAIKDDNVTMKESMRNATKLLKQRAQEGLRHFISHQ